jgi:hypothetical protein
VGSAKNLQLEACVVYGFNTVYLISA